MPCFLRTPLDRVRTIGTWEGWSFLILLFLAMPLKYGLGWRLGVTICGSLHGILFLLYWLVIAEAALAYSWTRKTVFPLLMAAIVPFGPFIADRCILDPLFEARETAADLALQNTEPQ
jgi:integral membrane protein